MAITNVKGKGKSPLVAESDTRLTGDEELAGLVRQLFFVRIDHEIFSMVILSLLLIQEWQLY